MVKNGLLPLIMLLSILSSCTQKEKETQETRNPADKTAMLLGVYHFANPGKDTYNLEIDDYFSPKRQRELEEITQLIEAYQPNKIFVELQPKRQPFIDSLYGRYLNDEIILSEIDGGQNEVYQIGFRLGKMLGIQEIVAIDYPGNWLGPYAEFIADTLSLDYYLSDRNQQLEQMKSRQSQFNSNTVKENLIFLNSWEQIIENHYYYNNVAIQVKDTAGIMFSYQEKQEEINGLPYLMRSFDFENIGIELVTEWYKRNLFIYRSILENTEPQDKVLILFGQGHVRYLHQLLEDNPEFKLVSPNKYLIRG